MSKFAGKKLSVREFPAEGYDASCWNRLVNLFQQVFDIGNCINYNDKSRRGRLLF